MNGSARRLLGSAMRPPPRLASSYASFVHRLHAVDAVQQKRRAPGMLVPCTAPHSTQDWLQDSPTLQGRREGIGLHQPAEPVRSAVGVRAIRVVEVQVASKAAASSVSFLEAHFLLGYSGPRPLSGGFQGCRRERSGRPGRRTEVLPSSQDSLEPLYASDLFGQGLFPLPRSSTTNTYLTTFSSLSFSYHHHPHLLTTSSCVFLFFFLFPFLPPGPLLSPLSPPFARPVVQDCSPICRAPFLASFRPRAPDSPTSSSSSSCFPLVSVALHISRHF